MTAVDHAELKRVAEGANPYWQAVDLACGGNPIAADLVAPFVGSIAPAVVLALLSEIEGLKAERDDEDVLIDVARILEDHVDYDDEGSENMVGLARRVSALSAAEAIAPYLRTQAPDSWMPDREAVARIVDEAVWVGRDETERCCPQFLANYRPENNRGISRSLAKADAILALRPQTAESGK